MVLHSCDRLIVLALSLSLKLIITEPQLLVAGIHPLVDADHTEKLSL